MLDRRRTAPRVDYIAAVYLSWRRLFPDALDIRRPDRQEAELTEFSEVQATTHTPGIAERYTDEGFTIRVQPPGYGRGP